MATASKCSEPEDQGEHPNTAESETTHKHSDTFALKFFIASDENKKCTKDDTHNRLDHIARELAMYKGHTL